MSAAFQYKPRFTDIRVKPPKPEEEAAAADVLHLKPGQKPCDWPQCARAATAKAPRARDRANDFYNFCQGHAAEYNKSWNYFAGMSEGEVREHQAREAATGGRPTWQMKAGRLSREAAAFAAKFGTRNTAGAGSWQDAFGLFGRPDQVTIVADPPRAELYRMALQAEGIEVAVKGQEETLLAGLGALLSRHPLRERLT